MDKAKNIIGAFCLAAVDDFRSAIDSSIGTAGERAAALIMIGAHPGLLVGEVARALHLTPSGAGRLIDRLESDGLVVRGALKGDLRSVVLSLTEAGQARRQKALDERAKALSHALQRLTEEEIETVANLLGKALGGLLTERDGQCYRFCRMCDEAACVPHVCPIEAQWALLFGGEEERARKP